MVKKRRRHTAAFKFRVALEALEGRKIGIWNETLCTVGEAEFDSVFQEAGDRHHAIGVFDENGVNHQFP